MPDGPQRNSIGSRLMREFSIGPVEQWLEKRSKWMIKEAGIQKHLAPKIQFEAGPFGKVEQGVRVLSIGSGKGHELDEMDSVLPGSEIIGLDPHDHHSRPVQRRLEKLAHNASYLPEHVSAENLEGVEDESLDGVTLFFVLHHIDEAAHDAVFNEAKRVMKPDGKLFIAEDLVDSETERQTVEQIDRRLNLEFAHDNPHIYRSMEQWNEFFVKQGLRVVEANEVKPNKVRHAFFVLEKS